MQPLRSCRDLCPINSGVTDSLVLAVCALAGLVPAVLATVELRLEPLPIRLQYERSRLVPRSTLRSWVVAEVLVAKLGHVVAAAAALGTVPPPSSWR